MKCLVLVVVAAAIACEAQTSKESWPTKAWPKTSPAAVGIDETALNAFDADITKGKYPLVDSMTVIRCGRIAYQRKYLHDYGQIFWKEAHTKGPLNAHLTGPYNYFDPEWHPYYHGTDEHTMQSASKTVTSVTIGIAITRHEFTADLNTPVVTYFDEAKVKNLDDRKRRMTIRHLLTMSTGLDWDEDVAYDDPNNACSQMEATDDWVQFVIDRPMAQEPGSAFKYSSGATMLLAHIFKKETGQDIEQYARKYLFEPLAIRHYYWKRTPLRAVDTEGGLYLSAEDLAKIGYLYLHHGMWAGKRIVSEDWVKQSLKPSIDATDGFKYGFQWWVIPLAGQRFGWAALGIGGQRLLAFPDRDLMVIFTGWDILGNPTTEHAMVQRILPAVGQQSCNTPTR